MAAAAEGKLGHRVKALRRQFLLSTATLMGALGGYGGRAYAACVNSGGSTYSCSGANATTQSIINADNAAVSTVAGFSVTSAIGNAIEITGDGALSYTDLNYSPLTAVDRALFIQSNGDIIAGNSGSITVDTNGTLAGGNFGIYAENTGSGALNVTANGNVTGTNFDGIFALNTGTDLRVATGAGTVVTGANNGINARNFGSGALTVTANGDVTGTNALSSRGIFARNYGTDLSVTTGAVTTVTGLIGILAYNQGSGALDVTANGDVTGNASVGLAARNLYGYGTDLSVTTAADTTVTGEINGIVANNSGSGAVTVTANGDVYGKNNFGIYARVSGTDLTVTTGEGTTVTGGNFGIHSLSFSGSAALTIEANGDVTGTNRDGIYARHVASGPVQITVGAAASVTSNGADANDFAVRTASGPTDVTVAGTLNGGGGGAVEFDQVAALDDRLELHPTATVNGNVFAGLGTDSFVLGGEGTASFDVSTIGAGLQYQDFEVFEKEDNSQWTLTSNNTTIPNFVVNGGLLSVNGSLPNTSFTVNSGTLGGTGTIGQLTVMSGGIFAPGNSIGTVTVNGNFTLNPGAIFEVEVNAAGQGDRAIVNGTVNLTGSALRVLAENGNYNPSTSYLIIDNDGADAVVGQFGTVTTNFAFLTPAVLYNAGTGNDVVLTLLRTVVPSNGGGGGDGGGGGGDSGGGDSGGGDGGSGAGGGGDGGSGASGGGDGGGTEFLSFCSVAETRNQCNVAHALDPFPFENPLFLAVLTQTVDGARQAFDALSGEIHATVPGVLVEDSRYVREAVLGRLIQATYTNNAGQLASLGASGPQVASLNTGIDVEAMALGYDGKHLATPQPRSGAAFWTRGYGAWGDFDGNRNAASADRDLGGFVSGIDARVGGTWRAGLAAGGSWSNISVGDRHSGADVESFHLAGYTGGMAGSFALRGGGAWAWNEIDTARAVIFPGFFEREQTSYDADAGQLFGEVAYPMPMGRAALEPFAGLAFVSIDSDSFKENGVLAALNGRGVDQDVGYSTLGLRAGATMHWGSAVVTPYVSAAWQHAFGDITTDTALAFASTGIGFTVTGVPLAEDTALIEAGFNVNLSPTAMLGASYSGQFGDGAQDNAVKGRLTWLF